MKRALLLLAAAALAAWPAAAQVPPPARDSVRDSVRGDSARAAPQPPTDTSRSGRVLREALQREPNNPAAHLAYGRYQRGASFMFARAEARGHFETALRLAHEQHNSEVEAAALVELGRINWVAYEGRGRRWRTGGAVTGIDPVQALADWRYVETFLEGSVAISEAAESEYIQAEDRARAALAASPHHPGATALLAVLLADRERWEELHRLADDYVRARRRDPLGYQLLGLALERMGRASEAFEAFDGALYRMTEQQRRPYEDLHPLLSRAGAATYDSVPAARRAEFRQIYWGLAQPLALDSVNSALVEYYARVTYADLRWTAPEYNLRGTETDRGQTYIRYGPPDIWVTLTGPNNQVENELSTGTQITPGRVVVLWAYRASHARFVFELTPGYNRAVFGGDFAEYARAVFNRMPVRFDNIPAIGVPDTIFAQVAQFRAANIGTTVAVFGFVPVGRLLQGGDVQATDLEAGAIVKDGYMRDVARRTSTERVTVGDSNHLETRTWRIDLAPGEYLLRLEARERSVGKAARSITPLQVRGYGGGKLNLSDVVVADRVQPRIENPRRWTDFLIDPSVGRFGRGAPLSVLWESYNLRPDSTGFAHYRIDVTITAREVRRANLAARIIGGIRDAVGLSARGDSVSLSFEREADVRGRLAVPEYLDVVLGDSPDGLYDLALTVTDRQSGESVTRRRPFVISANPGVLPSRAQDARER
jgi:GWxTD domain-containing protein